MRAGQPGSGGGLTPDQAMVWKYVAACALRADQTLAAPAENGGARFSGRLGLAPEWLDGTCEDACRQKVSACLLALTNRTGKHVQVSLLSASPGMAASLRPGEEDRRFPHQEGAFFGDVFGKKGYVCHGRHERKGPQVKRFCAADPASCGGLFSFVDAGACEDACTMSCARLGDGSQRCAAVSCKDPGGGTWRYPLTTYLRNAIEAGNADRMEGATSDEDQALVPGRDGGTADYQRVDFGAAAMPRRTFVARVAIDHAGGGIEISLASGRRLGTLPLPATGGLEKDAVTRLATAGLLGPQDLVLRFTVPKSGMVRSWGKISTIELR